MSSTERLPLVAAGSLSCCTTEVVAILAVVEGLAFEVSLASNVLPGMKASRFYRRFWLFEHLS
jgi:hypothetical protein